MVASILITVVSLVLLSYWFRYSCLLILRNQAQSAGVTQEEGDLDPLRQAVERDPAFGGVPEMVGGQVTLRLGGYPCAGDGVYLIQFVDDGDLGGSQSRQGRRHCGTGWFRNRDPP